MRLIDADALVKNIESAIENGYGVTVGDVIATIEYAPTIEPIQCGECIHHDAEISLCYYHNMHTTDGWFCADGERSEDEAY